MSLNAVQLIGNLATAPQRMTLPSGDRVTRCRLAVSQRLPSLRHSALITRRVFLTIESWNAGADRLALCHVGDRLHVSGSLIQKEWKTEEKIHRFLAVLATEWHLLAASPRPPSTEEKES